MNDSVMEGIGEGRVVLFLFDLCMLFKKVVDVEILWVLKCVFLYFFGSLNIGVNDLFKRMFCDSKIVVNYLMSELKFRYVIIFGFGLYFVRKLLYDVK